MQAFFEVHKKYLTRLLDIHIQTLAQLLDINVQTLAQLLEASQFFLRRGGCHDFTFDFTCEIVIPTEHLSAPRPV